MSNTNLLLSVILLSINLVAFTIVASVMNLMIVPGVPILIAYGSMGLPLMLSIIMVIRGKK